MFDYDYVLSSGTILPTLCMCIVHVAYQFPNFTISNEQLSFVNEFKYLGHIINNRQLDDADIYREQRNVFYHCNMLARRFYSCSVAVKLRLFKSFCLCFYDVALWNNFTAICCRALNK